MGCGSWKARSCRENTTMLDMCRRLGFAIRNDPDDPDIKIVTLPVAEIDRREELPE